MESKRIVEKISEPSDAALITTLMESGSLSRGDLAEEARKKLKRCEWVPSSKALNNRISILEERGIIKTDKVGRHRIKYLNPDVEIEFVRKFPFLPKSVLAKGRREVEIGLEKGISLIELYRVKKDHTEKLRPMLRDFREALSEQYQFSPDRGPFGHPKYLGTSKILPWPMHCHHAWVNRGFEKVIIVREEEASPNLLRELDRHRQQVIDEFVRELKPKWIKELNEFRDLGEDLYEIRKEIVEDLDRYLNYDVLPRICSVIQEELKTLKSGNRDLNDVRH